LVKQDRQAFGTLLSNNIELSEALKYPITTVPLRLTTAENQLRQGGKSIFRNFIIDESDSVRILPPAKVR